MMSMWEVCQTARSNSPVKGGVFLLCCALLTGCSAAHYRRSSDQEVYRIVEQFEQQVFGKTNAFTIDTSRSGRPPEAIPAAEILEDRMATNRRVVRLSEALELAVQHSREYQTQKEQLYLTALSLSGARYEFGPKFFADSTAQVGGSPSGSQSGSVRSRVGVSQFLRTGGRLSVSLANDLLRYFVGQPVGATRDSAINTLSVDLAQPILRGFGRNDPTVESLTQAERNVVYAIRTYSLYQEQFAVNIVNDYFSLLGQKDAIRNNYTNYLRRVDTTRYVQARSVDRVRASDVDDARTAELVAYINYVNSLASYLSQLDAFKIRLGLPLSEKLYLIDADLEAVEQRGLMPVGVDQNAAFRLAVESHMDLLNAIDRFEDSKRKVRLAADQLKPGLNLFANANLASEGPDDYTNFDPDKVRYSAGVQLDLPLDRLRQRNNYRAALVSFESQLRSLSATLDNFKDRIDRGLRTLEQQRLNYLNRQATLEVARRRVDMNQTLLEAGRVAIRDVRESQDALIAAENQLTDSMVRYLQARMQLLLDMGVLRTEVETFWLVDPLAGELAERLRGTPPLQMPGDELIPPDTFLEPSL